jgi:hypothetical protein
VALALRALDLLGHDVTPDAAHLEPRPRMGAQVVEPGWMVGLAVVGGDDEHGIALLEAEDRHGRLAAAPRPRGGEHHHRQA